MTRRPFLRRLTARTRALRRARPARRPAPTRWPTRRCRWTSLNSTSTAGLAATAAAALEELGWTVGEVSNYDGQQTPTVVLYPAAAEDAAAQGVSAATAAVVAADLGVGEATPSQDVDVLTVVLGPDYRP